MFRLMPYTSYQSAMSSHQLIRRVRTSFVAYSRGSGLCLLGSRLALRGAPWLAPVVCQIAGCVLGQAQVAGRPPAMHFVHVCRPIVLFAHHRLVLSLGQGSAAPFVAGPQIVFVFNLIVQFVVLEFQTNPAQWHGPRRAQGMLCSTLWRHW